MAKLLGGLLPITLLILLVSLGGERTSAGSRQILPALPPDPFVARIYYESLSDINKLSDYDLWEYNNLEEGYVLLSLSGPDYLALRDQGWHLTVDQEETAKFRNPDLRPFNDGYHTVDEIYTYLETI